LLVLCLVWAHLQHGGHVAPDRQHLIGALVLVEMAQRIDLVDDAALVANVGHQLLVQVLREHRFEHLEQPDDEGCV
jgi:hypothetical protein